MDIFLNSIRSKYRNTVLTSQENIDPRCLGNLYDTEMEIKKWVLKARTDGQMTQTQLGEAMGVTKGNVSAWENGRHEPSWTQMLKICELTNSVLPLPETLVTQKPKWPFTIGYDLFAAMPPEERQRIDKYLEFTVNDWHLTQHVKSKKAG
jgi:DNA-binding XRE family transcriptional regulator